MGELMGRLLDGLRDVAFGALLPALVTWATAETVKLLKRWQDEKWLAVVIQIVEAVVRDLEQARKRDGVPADAADRTRINDVTASVAMDSAVAACKAHGIKVPALDFLRKLIEAAVNRLKGKE